MNWPIIFIHTRQGRPVEQLAAIKNGVRDAVTQALDEPVENVAVYFVEFPIVPI